MSDDFISETTSDSWFSRIIESLKGILFGLVLFLGSFILLFWNEGRSVKQHQALTEGASSVVSIDASTVSPAHQNHLVHLSGQANSTNPVRDPIFGISSPSLKLIRSVEMFQWEETSKSSSEKNIGGSKETTHTYTYSKKWSNSRIASDDFQQAKEHPNPPFPYPTETFTASPITLGAFTLPPSLSAKITRSQPIPPDTSALPPTLAQKVKIDKQSFFIGNDPTNPQVGDLRIHFECVPPSVVSIIAKQTGSTFEPYLTKNGNSILLLQPDTQPAAAMFSQAEKNNQLLAWGLRVLGLLVMTFGLFLIVNPLAVLADVLPFLGSFVEVGLGIIAFLVSAVLSCLTIAIAWITYRPVIGVSLILLAIGLIILVKRKLPSRAPSLDPA